MGSKQLHKKGRNPGAVDNWLEGLGFYRKNVAYDETCLFRAVAEQLYDCQIYHERVRKECIEYARENYHEFSHLNKSRDEWFSHIQKLEKHMVVCGTIEINIISKRYDRDVLVFDASKQELQNVVKTGDRQNLLLCLMADHYDVVYKKEHIETAGFCQSIVYTVLYENVFGIKNVADIVNGMLYDKNLPLSQESHESNVDFEDHNNNLEELSLNLVKTERKSESEDSYNNNTQVPGGNNTHALAPFPFKVAKALDPSIYRNIEYDSWTEVRREMRLGEWYYGGNDKLILGTKCIFNDSKTDESYECYIQSILKDQDKYVIYITKLAEKRTVNSIYLSPEEGAKPWPLPYRFSKNLVLSTTDGTLEKTKTPRRRNRDKRRTQSCCEASTSNTSTSQNLNAFIGVPLRIRNMQTTVEETDDNQNSIPQSTSTETVEPSPIILPQPEIVVPSPDVNVSNNRYNWEPQWPQFVPNTETYTWAHTPTTPQSMYPFNFRPTGFIASAPVTPDVVPYHEYPPQYYYNYHQQVDPTCLFNNMWSTENHQVEEQSFTPVKTVINSTLNNSDQPHQRPTVCTTLTPSTPYSPMFTIPPGTPVIYASPHANEMSDVMMPTTPIIYAPPTPVDNVYVSPYIYPPTPPASWFPPGTNSQGFIFPTQDS